VSGTPFGIDSTIYEHDTEPNRGIAVSFWKTRPDADRLEREQFDNAKKAIQQMFESTPVIRTYDVHTSTAHRFNTEKWKGSRKAESTEEKARFGDAFCMFDNYASAAVAHRPRHLDIRKMTFRSRVRKIALRP
jgi:hypothetical protein